MLFSPTPLGIGVCHLREIREDDKAAFERLNQRVFFAYLRHMVGPGRYVDEALAAQATMPRTHWHLAIDDGRDLAGALEVLATPIHGDEGEIGFFIDPSVRGLGLVTAALRAALPAIRGYAKISSIMATVDPGNAASLARLKSIGLKPTARSARSYPGDPDDPSHRDAFGALVLRPRMVLAAPIEAVLARLER